MKGVLAAIAVTFGALLGSPVLAQSPAAQHLTALKSPAGARVYFIWPRDGAVLTSPVRVIFGLRGMGIAPAGVKYPNTGHHHLIIDSALPPLDQPLPETEHIHHFGKGQTETRLKLTPGKHTLQLLFADYRHLSFQPPVVSKKITITVRPRTMRGQHMHK